MRVRSRPSGHAMALVVAVAVVLVIVPVAPGQISEPQGIVASGPVTVSPARLEAYWTEERMAAARPMPLRRLARPERRGELAPESVAAEGPEERIPGRAPVATRREPEVLPPTAYIGPSEAIVDRARAYRYPFPYTRYEVFTPYGKYPYSAIGRLFFSYRGTDFVCTAAVGTERAIWTAGHCVATGGSWHTNMLFVPAYKNGRSPLGRWSAEQMFTTSTWLEREHNSRDMAMIVLQSQGGRRIGDRTGWLGSQWNAPRQQHWSIFGYPAARPFNGKRLWVCHASWAEDDRAGSAPRTVGAGCDLTGGSSGGPWITRMSGKSGETNYVNGVMSYGYDRMQDASYSPYFGNDARDLFNRVRNE